MPRPNTVFATMLAFASATPAFAQQQSVRLSGTIERVDGAVLTVKTGQGADVKVHLADKLTIYGVERATLAEVKPGAYVGVGALPQPDGHQRAVQVTILNIQRGLSEGHRPWDRQPNSTMTNGTVDSTIASVEGPVITVKYKDGEKKIVIPQESEILAYVAAGKDDLIPGARIAILNARKISDSDFEGARFNIGRGGVVPR